MRSENCQSSGPIFSSRRSTPDAKKLARGTFTSRSCFMCVMKRLPFTAKRNPSGVSSYQRAKLSGLCSE
jgi:hypothetical protein